MGFFSSFSTPAPPPVVNESVPEPNGHEALSLVEPIPVPEVSRSMPAAHLTAEQQSQVSAILDHFSSIDFVLPSVLHNYKTHYKYHEKRRSDDAKELGFALEPLSDLEMLWLTNEQIQRCLRATKWSFPKAIERLEETLVWRRDYGVDTLKGSDIEIESQTGKQYLYGYDKHNRPLWHMHPARQNTEVTPRRIRQVVFVIEQAIALMPPGVEKVGLAIDLGASKGRKEHTPMGLVREYLHILQTYYVERLGMAMIADYPTAFTIFFRIISPFIDPVTKEKIRFISKPAEAVEWIDAPSRVVKEFGADEELHYNQHEAFFAATEKLVLERRREQMVRWQTLCDSQIGASEWIIRGGHVDAVPTAVEPKALEKQQT